MATKIKDRDIVQNCISLAHDVVNQFPLDSMWIDYDREADVLYISFRKPQRATRTIEAEGDILIRKDGAKVVGVTILNASER
jgi:uncharacterized protein YuzE